ncbi:MAG: ABC transporter permease [Chloroflexi bacterium]|nr:ABC transporter permease [Chloroflexota bacterium]
MTRFRALLRRLRDWYAASRSAFIGGTIVLVLVVMTATVSLYSPYKPEAMDFMAPLSGPTAAHLLGTDNFGRDILTRVLYGYQISLAVALGSVGFGLAVGVTFGTLAGYFGGLVDNIIMRPMDVLMAFPAIVLVVALTGFVGREISVMVLAVAVVYVPIFARVMRGSTLEVVNELYVEGARARGASHLRLMLRHILPNAIAPVLIQASILMGIAILLESALSFIGLGTQPPDPSLGLMLSEGRSFMQQAPWMVMVPGLAISIAVLGFNLLGNGLQDLLNPASRSAAANRSDKLAQRDEPVERASKVAQRTKEGR